MAEPRLGFFARIPLAFGALWKILFNRAFASQVWQLRSGVPPSPPKMVAEPRGPIPAQAVLKEEGPGAALQLLGLLQREGRLVDFLQEPVDAYSDTEVGAAARVVHAGCRRALSEHLHMEPIRSEAEGAVLALEEGFDAAAIRLTGNVVGGPPFKGRLVHRGWRAVEVKLPKLTAAHDVTVVAPAEVEL